jgi:hypothetical protein
MPLYEYQCKDCGEEFEKLSRLNCQLFSQQLRFERWLPLSRLTLTGRAPVSDPVSYR